MAARVWRGFVPQRFTMRSLVPSVSMLRDRGNFERRRLEVLVAFLT